jgi:hypothetical protein
VDRPPPPLLGFNNNVQHNGRTFHIQTEDSGIKYCRVVTHLFADGGRIVQTRRTDYSPQLGQPDLIEQIRRLMKDQHRMMFSALRSGEFDEVIRNTFEGPTLAEVEAANSPMSQRPHLRFQEMPPLNLRAAGESDTPATVSASNPKRPSSRPKRPSSRAPAANSGRKSSTPPSRQAAANSPKSTSQIINTAKRRPASPSNNDARRQPKPSLFGDTAASEQSLDDVILSYLEDDAGDGS